MYVHVLILMRRFDIDLFSLTDKIGVISTVCPCHHNPNDCVRLKLIQKDLIYCTMLWFGHTFVSECLIY